MRKIYLHTKNSHLPYAPHSQIMFTFVFIFLDLSQTLFPINCSWVHIVEFTIVVGDEMKLVHRVSRCDLLAELVLLLFIFMNLMNLKCQVKASVLHEIGL